MSNIIIIDIGHGVDTFPPSKGLYLPDGTVFHEHQFNADVGVKTKELAVLNGFEVIFTQEPYKKDVPLQNRTNYANNIHRQKGVLCLISLHANAGNDHTSNGYGVFHWETSQKGKKLAELWLKYADEILPSERWGAGIWQSKLNHWSNFHVLRETSMPSILIEHFFFTNLNELKLFNTSHMINKCAEIIVKMLCEYTKKVFNLPSFTPPLSYQEAVKILNDAEIINSPTLWLNDIDNATQYIDKLIINMAEYIRQGH